MLSYWPESYGSEYYILIHTHTLSLFLKIKEAPRFEITNLLGANEGEEHVESNLDTVDEDKSMLGGDELEVDSVDKGPDLPGSLAGSEQVILDLVSNGGKGVSVNQSKVCEEDSHENRAPDDLIKRNLLGNRQAIGSFNLAVEPVVEVVSRWSMVQETKGRKSNETLPVKCSQSSSFNEDLHKKRRNIDMVQESESSTKQGVKGI